MLAIDRKNDRYTICEGRCAKRYHATCVGLLDATVCALFAKNILWMCDDCLAEYCANRDAEMSVSKADDDDVDVQAPTVESDILDLRSKIEDIFDTLATIVPHQQQICEIPNSFSVPSPALSSTRLFNGSKVNLDDDTSAGVCTHAAVRKDDTFALFLTNIDCCATEEDVNRLVCDCLDITDRKSVRIKKLVPKGRPTDMIDFISFKVVVDMKLKDLAMEPSTWPIGLRYREFENRTFVWIPKCNM